MLTLADGLDTSGLSSADGQTVLAWVVGILLLAVGFLVRFVLKQASENKEELKTLTDEHKAELAEERKTWAEKEEKLEAKVDGLQERLLKVVTHSQAILASFNKDDPPSV